MYVVYFKNFFKKKQRIEPKEPRKDPRIQQKARAGKALSSPLPLPQFMQRTGSNTVPSGSGAMGEADPHPQAGQPEQEMEMCLRGSTGFLLEGADSTTLFLFPIWAG